MLYVLGVYITHAFNFPVKTSQLNSDPECILVFCLQIPTDGLILKGWYTTLTIAVYGALTIVAKERVSPPPPPPPQPRPKPQGEWILLDVVDFTSFLILYIFSFILLF